MQKKSCSWLSVRPSYVIIICVNNNTVINYDYGRLQDLIFLSKIPMGTRNKYFRNLWTIWARALKKRLTSPALGYKWPSHNIVYTKLLLIEFWPFIYFLLRLCKYVCCRHWAVSYLRLQKFRLDWFIIYGFHPSEPFGIIEWYLQWECNKRIPGTHRETGLHGLVYNLYLPFSPLRMLSIRDCENTRGTEFDFNCCSQ